MRNTQYKTDVLPADQETYGERCVLCMFRTLLYVLMAEGMAAVSFSMYLYSATALRGVLFMTLLVIGAYEIVFSFAVNRWLSDRATLLQCYMFISMPVVAVGAFVGFLSLWLGLSYTESWAKTPPEWAEDLFQVSKHPELLNAFNPRIGGLILCSASIIQMLCILLAHKRATILNSKALEMRIPIIDSIAPAYNQHRPQDVHQQRLSEDRAEERTYLKTKMSRAKGGGYMQRFHNKYYTRQQV